MWWWCCFNFQRCEAILFAPLPVLRSVVLLPMAGLLVTLFLIHLSSLSQNALCSTRLSAIYSALMRSINLILNRSVSAGLVNRIATIVISFLRCWHQASLRASSASKVVCVLFMTFFFIASKVFSWES